MSVGNISGVGALSYLDQIRGPAKVAPTAKTAPVSKQDILSDNLTQPDGRSLQSSGALQLSPELLSILQGDNSTDSSTNVLDSLLGNKSSNNLVSSLFGNGNISNALDELFSGSGNAGDPLALLITANASNNFAAQSASSTRLSAANTQSQSTPVQDLLSARNTGANAYNRVLLQNAQTAITKSIQVQQSLVA